VSSKRRLHAAADSRGDAEVQADRLGVPDVQVAVRLGREARVHAALLTREVTMHRRLIPAVAALVALLLAAVPEALRTAPRPGIDWPQFRGINAQGVAEGPAPATAWNVETGEQIAWKTAIPGLGLSSPVVWGDRVCLTTAISGKADAGLKPGLYGNITPVEDDTEHEWRVMCYDKGTGKLLWQHTAHRGVPKVKRHTKSTHANSTTATDGTHLVAFFGSEGLHAYTLDGKPLWKKDLGVLDAGYFQVPAAQWETGSSPVIHDGVVLIQADVQKGSFLAAFDVKTGKELWRTPREDVPTWGSPAVHQAGGRTQVVVNGWHHIGGYDFETGNEVWKLKGGGDIPVPTPVVHDGLIYITNAHGPMSPTYAIRTTARGDISLADGATSNEHIAWSHLRDGGYMCTPLVYQGLVYIVRYNGVVSAYDAKTGERKYQQRFAGARRRSRRHRLRATGGSTSPTRMARCSW
jgi:outer membrane protein assembly factor BamB